MTVYDHFTRDALRYKTYRYHPHLRIVHGDVMDVEALKNAIQGATYVIHAAGIAGVETVIHKPIRKMQVNMIGSANLLEGSKNRIRRRDTAYSGTL